MLLFLLGTNVTDDAALCDLGNLGDFVPVDEKTSVSSMYVPKLLEKFSNFILNTLSLFEFFGAFDEVSVFLGLYCFWEDDFISSPLFKWLVAGYLVDDFTVLS